MRFTELYILKFRSGKVYVGLTSCGLPERLRGHAKAALKQGSKLPVHNAWRLHGEPRAVVVCRGDLKAIQSLERETIALFETRAPGGYNVSFGGETSPAITPEFKAAMSGDRNPMRRPEVVAKRFANGHHMKSPEQRARASEQQRNNNNMNSSAARAKSSASHKGSRWDPETKAARVAAMRRWFPFRFTKAQLAKRGAATSAGCKLRREFFSLLLKEL